MTLLKLNRNPSITGTAEKLFHGLAESMGYHYQNTFVIVGG